MVLLVSRKKNGLLNNHVEEPFSKICVCMCVAQDFVSVGAKSE